MAKAIIWMATIFGVASAAGCAATGPHNTGSFSEGGSGASETGGTGDGPTLGAAETATSTAPAATICPVVKLAETSADNPMWSLAIQGESAYWLQWATIFSVPKAGGASPYLLGSAGMFSENLAVDEERVYFTASGSDPSKGSIGALARGNGATTWSVLGRSPGAIALGPAAVLYSEQVEVKKNLFRLASVPRGGGATSTLYMGDVGAGDPAPMASLVADANSAHWIAISPARLIELSLAGGSPITLVIESANESPVSMTQSLTQGGSVLYYLSYNVPSEKMDIKAFDLSTQTKSTVASGTEAVALAADQGTLFWISCPFAQDATWGSTSNCSVHRTAPDGTTTELIASTANISSIAVDSAYTYWIEDHQRVMRGCR